MALNCQELTNIIIDGNNYGGVLYDLKVDINFNSSSILTASFISESGNYTISENNLSAESPSILRMGGRTFRIYAVNFKYQISPAGRLLVVKYIDSSHLYLDKINIVLKQMSGERLLSIIPTNEKDAEIEGGKYTPKDLYTAMSGVVPMTNRVKNLLNKYPPKNTDTKVSGLYLDTMGTLRSVLNDFGTKIGYIFYWDWTIGDIGKLDAMSYVSSSRAKALANKFEEEYKPYIASYEKSYSIEDNYTNSNFVYDTMTSKTDIQGENKKKLNILYSCLNLARNNFWLKPRMNAESGNLETSYFTVKELQSRDFLKLCVAAAVGEDFFNKYIEWNLVAESVARAGLLPLTKIDGSGDERTEGLPTNTVEKYNKFVSEIFSWEPYIKFRLLFARREGMSLDEEVSFANNARALNRAEIIKRSKNIKKEDLPEVKNKFGSSAFWYYSVNLLDFDKMVSILYKTCVTYANNFGRYYLSSKRAGTLNNDTLDQIIVKREITYKTANFYGLQDNWVWEFADAEETFLEELVGYAKMPTLTENAVADQKDIHPAFQGFHASFKLANDAKTEPEDEKEKDKLDGFLFFERRKDILPKVKDDISVYAIKDDLPKNTENQNLISEERIITSFSKVEDYVEIAALQYGINNFGNPRIADIQKKHYAITETESDVEINDWTYSYRLANQKDNKTLVNNIKISKVPEIGGEKVFDKESYLETLSEDMGDSDIAANFSMTIASPVMINEKFADSEHSWLYNGLESYSIQSNGSDGISVSVSIGSRKKQKQAAENQERLVSQALPGTSISRIISPKPSVARGFTSYGLKAFA